jgi:hypothetical protein
MLCVRAGAARVFCVDVPPAIDLARRIAQDNDMADRISFIPARFVTVKPSLSPSASPSSLSNNGYVYCYNSLFIDSIGINQLTLRIIRWSSWSSCFLGLLLLLLDEWLVMMGK